MTTAVSTKDFEELELFKKHMRDSRPTLRNQYGEAYNKFIAPLLDDMMEDLEEYVETVGEEAMLDEDLEFDLTEDEE